MKRILKAFWKFLSASSAKLIFMGRHLFFTHTQKALLKECRLANSDEHGQWLLKNLWYPLVIIILPLGMYFVFPTTVLDFKSLVFNGAISLLGVNILFGMSSYLIKFNHRKPPMDSDDKEENGGKLDEEKLNKDMYYLREKLNSYKNILVLIGASFYISQRIFSAYKSDLVFYVFICLTIGILLASIIIGRYMFLIKDDFVENTFYNKVNTPVINTYERWSLKFPKS